MNQTVDRRRFSRLDLIPASAALVAVGAMLRGQPAGGWTAAIAGVLILLVAIVPTYRQRWRDRWHSAWRAISEFDHAQRLPWPAVFLLVVVPDLLFLLARDRGMQSGDSRPIVMTAASLLRGDRGELSAFVPVYVEHRLFTAADAPPYFFLPCRRGVYSHYPSGMVVFALPIAAAADLLAADLDDPNVHERLEKLTAACVSAASLGLFFLLASHIGPPASASIATLLLATGSVMFSTVGQALWQHGGVIFWLELLLLVEFRSFTSPCFSTVAIQAVCCAMMLACRLSAGLIVASFGLWLFVRSPRRAVVLAVLALVALSPWAAVNQAIYGSPLGPMNVQAKGTFWSFSNLEAWAGILVSPTHGLLVYQPWMWLLPLAAFLIGGWGRAWPKSSAASANTVCPGDAPVRSVVPPGWQLWAASVIGLHLALLSGWHCWWGGWCWGSRLAAEIVPLAALLALEPLARLWAESPGRKIVWATIVLSALMHVPSVYLQQQRWYSGVDIEHDSAALWRWSAPPFLFPLRR